MNDSEYPNIPQRAATLLNDLRTDLNALQITMLLAVAQYLHTIDTANTASMQKIVHGDHLQHYEHEDR